MFEAFPEIQEFEGAALDVAALQRAFAENECAIVRNLLPPGTLHAVRKAVDAINREQRDKEQPGSFKQRIAAHRATLSNLGPQPASFLIQTFFSGPLLTIAETLLADEPSLLVDLATFRRHNYSFSQYDTPFHQDWSFIWNESAEEPDEPALVFWIPLDRCGPAIAPCIELLGARLDGPLAYGVNPEGGNFNAVIQIPDSVLEKALKQAPRWIPRFNVGDVLLMSDRTVHRTVVDPAIKTERVAFNCRLVSQRTLRKPGCIPRSPTVRLQRGNGESGWVA